MPMKYFFQRMALYAIVLLAVSCKGKSGQEKQSDNIPPFPTFDLQQEYAKKEMSYQDIAEVEYIPLETNDSSLISSTRYMFVSEKMIVALESKEGNIIFFDRKGKYLHSFSHKGESGEEYLDASRMTVDFAAEEVYIYDYRGVATSYIQVYGFDGTYKRTFKYPTVKLLKITDYDKDHLFAEDETFMFARQDGKNVKEPTHTPYGLISKQTGEIKTFPLYVEERINGTFVETTLDTETEWRGITINFPLSPVSVAGSRIVISDFGLDTIYTCHDGRLQPIAAKSNRVTEMKSTIMTEVCALTDRYLLLCTQDKRLLTKTPSISVPDPIYLLYDRTTGETCNILFQNADGITYTESVNEMSLWPHSSHAILPPNTMRMAYKPDFLLEKYEKGELKGRLKEIASQLDIEDNPVLVLVRFKE